MGNMGSATLGKNIQHPKFGQIPTVVKDGKAFMVPTFSIMNEEGEVQWQKRFIKAKNQQHSEYILLPEQHYFDSVPCGLSKSLKIYFDYFPFDLEYEISNRIKLNVYFTETQLYSLLYSLLNVSHQFQTTKDKSGNIKPSNILVNQRGVIKVITKLSYPGFMDSYKSALFDKQKSFIAPEEINYLKKANEAPVYSLPKSQSFSIGMTLLSSGLLSNLLSLYSEDYQFDENSFQKCLKAWKDNKHYSTFFKECVLMMVNKNSQQRISPGELLAYLSPYQQQIKSSTSFSPDEYLSMDALDKYMKNGSTIRSPERLKFFTNYEYDAIQIPVQRPTLQNNKTVERIPAMNNTSIHESTLTTKRQHYRTCPSNNKSLISSQKLNPTPVPIMKSTRQTTSPPQRFGKKLSTIGQEQSSNNLQSLILEFKTSLQNQRNHELLRKSDNV